MQVSHIAQNLSHSLIIVFSIFGIEEIFSLSFDNTYENTAINKYLGNYTRPILNGKLFHVHYVVTLLICFTRLFKSS